MSPNAATKGNALWKPGTEREISMDTSKALRQSEAPQAWSEIIPLGFLPVVAPVPSSLVSAFEVSIEISFSVPAFHKALPFVAALGDIR